MIEKLMMYLQYPFVRYALIVGMLIALCSSLLGVTLVLKRFSFIGDGLSHVAFGAIAVASVLNLSNNMINYKCNTTDIHEWRYDDGQTDFAYFSKTIYRRVNRGISPFAKRYADRF